MVGKYVIWWIELTVYLILLDCKPRLIKVLFSSFLLLTFRSVTSLGHQGWQRVLWEGPRFFKLFPTRFSREGKKFPRGLAHLVTDLLTFKGSIQSGTACIFSLPHQFFIWRFVGQTPFCFHSFHCESIPSTMCCFLKFSARLAN